MNRIHPIDPQQARQAALDYVVIDRAGYLPTLRRNIELAIEAQRGPVPTALDPVSAHIAYEATRLDQWRDGNGWGLRQIEGDAAALASLLDCEVADVMPYLFAEIWTGPTLRKIVLTCLKELANELRRQQAGQARRRS